MVTQIEEEIKRHTEEVIKGKVNPDEKQCPYCQGEPQFFCLHEKRERQFWVLVVDVVKKIVSLLIRWKCPLCGRTFTEYPEFALAHKRHVKKTVLELSDKYVSDKGKGNVTYQSAVEVDWLQIGYVDEADNAKDPKLAPPTVWKWVGFLGKGDWLEKMLALIKEKMPQTGIFRVIKPVPACKYRSEERREILARCMRVWEVTIEFKKLFGFSPSWK